MGRTCMMVIVVKVTMCIQLPFCDHVPSILVGNQHVIMVCEVDLKSLVCFWLMPQSATYLMLNSSQI